MTDGKKGKPTGGTTRKGRSLKIRSGKPEDPIFSRGFVIGGVGRKKSAGSTPAKD